MSPVISYTTVNGIETLGQFLKDSNAEHYDFDTSDMDLLISDKIVVPEMQFTLPAKKLLVFAGLQDDQIPFNNIENFCKKHILTLKILSTGHITFSKITEDMNEIILNYLNHYQQPTD